MDILKICFVTSELAPIAKVGGLADVAAALPRVLQARGHDVRVFVPLYGRIDTAELDLQVVGRLENVPLRVAGKTFRYTLLEATLPDSGLVAHFVHCAELYGRQAIYTSDPDEPLRYLFLSRAVIEVCQYLQWAPDVFHCNDWQSALLPVFLRTTYSWDRLFAASRTLLTIHNLGYQGVFSTAAMGSLGLEGAEHLLDRADIAAGRISFLKAGIASADHLSTVSPTYAREIQTEAYGMGLDQALRSRSNRLTGILNGVDYQSWHPRTDRYLPYRYSEKSLWRKERNKHQLLADLRLSPSPDTPLAGMVSRLAAQKGIDLLYDPLPELLGAGKIALIVVGNGESRYVEFLNRLQASFPDRVCFYNGFSNELAHLVEGGADLFLMPSRYEPCGLNQMYSLKYGTVPVVRKTGGLADTVELYDPDEDQGTGFVFEHYTAAGLRWALDCAVRFYADRKVWRRLMTRGMTRDFSWETQVEKYLDLYGSLVGVTPAADTKAEG